MKQRMNKIKTRMLKWARPNLVMARVRRGLWPAACRAYVYVLPTLRFYGHFLWVPANTQKVARFAAFADFGGPNLATGRCTDGEKSKNELQASYRPKKLTI